MMRHLMAILSLLALTLASAAPVPTHLMPKPIFYYPTTVGTKWVYQNLQSKSEATFVLTKAEDRGQSKIVTVGLEENGKVTPFRVVEVSERGLAQSRIYNRVVGYEKEDTQQHLLKLPIEQGGQWMYDSLFHCHAFEKEELIVPAGTFQCIRVEVSMVPSDKGPKYNGPMKMAIWYAPGIGQVKIVDGPAVRVLKSFTVGKPSVRPN